MEEIHLERGGSGAQTAESEAIVALNSARWNRKQVAMLLGVDYKALLYKMKKLSIGEKAIKTSAS